MEQINIIYLKNNICVVTQKYINPINTKKHQILVLTLELKIPPLMKIACIIIVIKLTALEPSTTCFKDNNMVQIL